MNKVTLSVFHHRGEKQIKIEFDYNAAIASRLKAAGAKWSKTASSWTEIEEQISAARRTYNAAVTAYNNSVEMFPTNIMANMMGYKRKEVLAIEEAERKNVSAKDLFNK